MAHRAVYKSKAAEALDKFFSGEPLDAAFDEADRLLRKPEKLSETTRELESGDKIDHGSATQFDRDWLDASSAKHGKDVERLLRHGYRQAIARARARKLPIETWWVTGAGDALEVHVSEGKRQVTVHMFIPGEETREYGSDHAESRSWVVRVNDLEDVRPTATRQRLDEGDDTPVFVIQVSGPATAAY